MTGNHGNCRSQLKLGELAVIQSQPRTRIKRNIKIWMAHSIKTKTATEEAYILTYANGESRLRLPMMADQLMQTRTKVRENHSVDPRHHEGVRVDVRYLKESYPEPPGVRQGLSNAAEQEKGKTNINSSSQEGPCTEARLRPRNKGSQNIEKTNRSGQPKPPECTTKEEVKSDLDGNFGAFP